MEQHGPRPPGLLATLVRNHREAAGLTQRQLAGRSGISLGALQDLEQGRTVSPRPHSLARLAAALQLSGQHRDELIEAPASAVPPARQDRGVHGHGALQVAILGPLAAWRDGLPVALGPVRQRAVLGLLALHAGTGLRRAAIVDALWGEDPPPTSVVMIQAHVSRVRRLLKSGEAPAAGKQLSWDGSCYRLGPDSIRLDLAEFGELTEDARRAAAAGDQAAACELYERALGLWRGQPLDDIDVLRGHPAVTGISRRRAAVVAEYLESRLGTERVTAEPAAVTELTGLCARLPLALVITAARAVTRPSLSLAKLAAELRGAGARLDVLGTGDPATDVRTVLSWSCLQLSAPAARMFRLLGVHPGPNISAPAAASLVGLPPGQAREALAELASASLITEQARGRYAFHDLLRACAAEQARSHDSETTRRASLHRILDHYLHTAGTASLVLSSYRDPVTLSPPLPGVRPEELADREDALAWFQAELPVLLAATRVAADDGFHAHAWQLPWAMATFLDWHGYWHEQVATQRSALAAARYTGDQTGQAQAHSFLGRAQLRLGAYDEASRHLTAALELGRLLGSGAFQARVHLEIGRALELQGSMRDALGHAEQSLRLYQAAGHRWGEAIALNAVGWSHTRLGSYGEALDVCGQALLVYRELGIRLGQSATLDSLGYAHHQLGNHAEAIDCYQQALDIHGDTGDRSNRADVLTHLGDTRQAAGDQAGARDAWQEALVILDDLQHPDAGQVRSRLSTGHAGATAS